MVAAIAIATGACGPSQPTPTGGVASLGASNAPGLSPGATSSDFTFAIDGEPTTFAGAPDDDATRWISRVINAGLYVNDDRLQPQPALAAALPTVSPDGLTWTIRLRDGLAWSDGSPLSAADVQFSYELLRSGRCTQDHALCGDFQQNVVSVTVVDAHTVALQLQGKFAPLLSVDLVAPVLPQSAVTSSVQRLLARVAGVQPAQVQAETDKITRAMGDPACGGPGQPPPCDPSSYVPELEDLLHRADLPLPDRNGYTDEQGTFDQGSYGQALIQTIDALGATLQSTGTDQVAAALELTDFARNPVGAGPYVVETYAPGHSVTFRRNPHYYRIPAGPPRAVALIIKDPAAAATALKQGDILWDPAVSSDALPSIQGDPNLRTSQAADFGYYYIGFNLRKGHLFADINLRRAFSECIDHDKTVQDATGGNGIPVYAEIPPASWAYNSSVPAYSHDVDGARKLIESSGWTPGSDGVYEKNGQRLSSVLYVQRIRPDRLAFARLAQAQLAQCGIEISVREVDFETVLLSLLRYPNNFDLYLGGWRTSVDPDDYGVFHSSQITTKAVSAVSNFVGYSDPAVDALLVQGRQTTDPAQRRAIYSQLQVAIHDDLPYYFLWSDSIHRGYSTRISAQPPETIDLQSPFDYWNLDDWVVAPG